MIMSLFRGRIRKPGWKKSFSPFEHSRSGDAGSGDRQRCTGSEFLYYCREAHGMAVDISEEALQVARENAGKNGVEKRLDFYQGIFCMLYRRVQYLM